MRPVNLIPVEDRHGQNAPLRTGPVAYIVIGALVLALAGVTMLVLTDNKVADSKSELAQVKSEDAAAKARAESLASYTQFAALHEQRVATIASLADSRFDWERVMRELSKVLPADVWLTTLNASASPEAASGSGGSSTESSGASGLRSAIAGPALEINGCANGQDGVAGFVTALKEIDGVTRVGVQSSALPTEESAAESGEGAGGGGTDCRTRNFIAQFEIVVAFDAAPVASPVEATAVETTEAAPEGSEESSESSEGSEESSTEG